MSSDRGSFSQVKVFIYQLQPKRNSASRSRTEGGSLLNQSKENLLSQFWIVQQVVLNETYLDDYIPVSV